MQTGSIMTVLPRPGEYRRLRALRELSLTDADRCGCCEALVSLAATYFNVSMGMIALTERDDYRVFAEQGMDRKGASRTDAICNIVMDSGEAQIIADTHADLRTVGNTFVTELPFIRFYAGYPIHSPDGYIIGVFCLLDRKPRKLLENDESDFRRFGAIAQEMVIAYARQIAFKRNEADLALKTQQLVRANRAIAQVGRIAKIGTWEFNTKTREITWSDEIYRIREIDVIEPNSLGSAVHYYAEYDRERVKALVQDAIVDGKPFDYTADIITAKGNVRHIRSTGERDQTGTSDERVFGVLQDLTDVEKRSGG